MKENKNSKIFLESLISFLPRNVIKYKISPIEQDNFQATLLFADISGFTAMSENLSKLGKEGSEEVNRIINNYFSPLIEIIYKHNGDIIYFGGDAFLAYFKDDEDSTENAVSTATEILTFAEENSQVNTKTGVFNIKLHIGLNKGKVYYFDLRNTYLIAGNTINELMNIVDIASAGEIVVSESVKKNIKNFSFKEVNGAYKYVKGKISVDKYYGNKEKKFLLNDIPLEMIREFIPEWLFKRIQVKPYFDYKDGEHRKITFLFIHFSGISYDKNKDKGVELLKKFYKILRETTNKYDGWINRLDVYKDSERIIVIFGFPNAYEDEEKRAMIFINDLISNSEIHNIKIRAGVNSGFVFIAPLGNEIRREYTMIGDAVNLCARIAASADNGDIVVTEEIYNKTYDLFEYKFLGEREYKGKKDKIPILKLINKKESQYKGIKRWIGESESIVGRKKEIKKIREIVNAVLGSKGQILCIVGEPGIGKTRLTEEFITICKQNGFGVYLGDCISYGSSFSYYPFIDILLKFFSFTQNDLPETKKEKIKKKCEEVNKELIEWLPLIGEVIGLTFPETKLTKYLDPKIKKQRINEIILEIIKYESNVKPVTIIIEDVHWADSGSMDVINYICRNIEKERIIMALVYRPMETKEEFMGKKWSNELLLKELKNEEILELIENLLNIKNIPEDFKNIIFEKSQGNPFYVEELVKSLIEQGNIIEEKEGWSFKTETKELKLPDTLESLILSRIDRLDFQDRNVLQIASVLGKEFDEFLIQGIYGNKTALNKSLKNLKTLDLLRKEKKEGEIKFYFKHILTREVAYNTLSYARKEELHRNTGVYIEIEMKERKDEFLPLLSYHFYMGKDYEKSLIYSVQVGEKAKKVYANEEAIEFFKRAIESYEILERDERSMDKKQKKELYIKALEGIGLVEYILGKYDESIKKYEKIQEICDDDPYKKSDAIIQNVITLIVGKGEIEKAQKILFDLILKLDKEKELHIRILNLLGIIERRRSNYDEAIQYFKDALQLSIEIGDNNNTAGINANLALVAYNKGEYDIAIETYEKVLDMSKDLDDPISLGVDYNNIGLIFQAKKEFDKALEYYNKALEIMLRTGYKSNYGHTLGNIGAVYKEKGDYNKALEYYNRSLEIAKELNDIKQMGIIFSLIGVVYLQLNDLDKSLENTNNALIKYNKIGDKRLIATCYKTLGEINIKLKKLNEAYEYLKKSETLFERIGNKLELENVRSLLKEIEVK